MHVTADCLISAHDLTVLPKHIMTAPRDATVACPIMTMTGPEHPPTAMETVSGLGDHGSCYMPTRRIAPRHTWFRYIYLDTFMRTHTRVT